MATEAPKSIAWQTALYLIVVFVIVSIVGGIIVFVGRVEWTIPTPSSWRAKMESRSLSGHSSDSTSYFPSPYTLVSMMICYFSTTFLPAFQRLRSATTSSVGAPSRPRPQPMILPLFTAPGFREPVLTPPRPAVPRDVSSFRVPSNPYSGGSASASAPHSNLPSPAHHSSGFSHSNLPSPVAHYSGSFGLPVSLSYSNLPSPAAH